MNNDNNAYYDNNINLNTKNDKSNDDNNKKDKDNNANKNEWYLPSQDILASVAKSHRR